jgi:hypothetical protein
MFTVAELIAAGYKEAHAKTFAKYGYIPNFKRKTRVQK